jgi:hypothetical protein
MSNNFKKAGNIMNKEVLIAIIVTTLVAGLMGFYGGRYYEKGRERNMRGKFMENVEMRGEGREKLNKGDGIPLRMQNTGNTAPATTPVETK